MENTNSIRLSGRIDSEIKQFSVASEVILEFTIAVARQSKYIDRIMVNMPVNILLGKELHKGDSTAFAGQIRTYNIQDEKGSHLLVVVFAQTIIDYCGDVNEAQMCGYICKNPNVRQTPLGRDICDLLIAVNTNKRSSYIPCLAWGRNAILCGKMSIGTCVRVKGRLQSRLYQKISAEGMIEKTAYELSLSQIELGGIDEE